MSKLQGVADTLYLPLAARIYVSERFPEFFYDAKALSLKGHMPYEDIISRSSEYFEMAGACRFYNTDGMIRDFIAGHERSNIINLGCGFETSYFRIQPDPGKAVFYEMDLPEVIASRKKVLGDAPNEVLIGGDMFDFRWAEGIDTTLPTLITVIGVFQYFEEEKVRGFLKQAANTFTDAGIIFDAMTHKALKFANAYVKRTGNKNALMHFGIDNAPAFAASVDLPLLEERPIFKEARTRLKRKLNLITRISMKIADEGSRRGFLLRMGDGS